MKKNLTELVFILDESGSMSGLTDDTIGGFNSLIAKQKTEEGEALVSTVFFSNESKVIHDRVRLEDVPQLTGRDYVPSGCTALLDAVGDAVRHISNIHKYSREEALAAFIRGYDANRDGKLDVLPVRDILLGLRTYSRSGN